MLGIVALAVLYRGAAEVGYELQFAGPVAAIVWLPVGVGVAFLYLGGLRFWPGVLVGDLLANDYAALPLGSALGQTSGNVLEVLVGDRAAARGSSRAATRSGASAASAGCSLAIAAGTAVSATVGSLSLWLGDVIEPRRGPARVAHLVARRRHRRADRAPARARLGAAAAARAGGAGAAPRRR